MWKQFYYQSLMLQDCEIDVKFKLRRKKETNSAIMSPKQTKRKIWKQQQNDH